MKIQRITVLYADGDPNVEATRAAVGTAMRQTGIDPATIELTEVVVRDRRGASAQRMLGSPTVQVNDQDVEGRTAAIYTNKPRQYRVDGRFVPVPTAELIARAIVRAQGLPGRVGPSHEVTDVSIGKPVPAQLPPM